MSAYPVDSAAKFARQRSIFLLVCSTTASIIFSGKRRPQAVSGCKGWPVRVGPLGPAHSVTMFIALVQARGVVHFSTTLLFCHVLVAHPCRSIFFVLWERGKSSSSGWPGAGDGCSPNWLEGAVASLDSSALSSDDEISSGTRFSWSLFDCL